jgi:hypothetical protein
VLLVYADRQESLGQWRHDWEVESIEPTGSIWVFSDRDAETNHFVNISGCVEQGKGWREIPMTAEIVWWFTAYDSVIEVNLVADPLRALHWSSKASRDREMRLRNRL